MELENIRIGMHVKVIADNGTMGMFVKPKHLVHGTGGIALLLLCNAT